MKLRFKRDFDIGRLSWGRPDSPVRALCSLCHGKLDEIPLMMWDEKGYCIQLCEDCIDKAMELVKV